MRVTRYNVNPQAMAGVLHKLLHTYTDTAISVTSGLVTSITRFAVQVKWFVAA